MHRSRSRHIAVACACDLSAPRDWALWGLAAIAASVSCSMTENLRVETGNRTSCLVASFSASVHLCILFFFLSSPPPGHLPPAATLRMDLQKASTYYFTHLQRSRHHLSSVTPL